MSQFPFLTRFRIDDSEIISIADAWFRQHVAVDAIGFETLTATTGHGSDIVAALHSTAIRATAATHSIGTRLGELSSLLRAFDATSDESDRSAAAGFDRLRER